MMVPNLFWKKKLPDNLPTDMQKSISQLKKSKSKEECLRKAYQILAKKYRGYKVKTYILFWEAFITSPEKLWAKKGFMHCTNLNYLLRILLAKSGFFEDNDIKLKLTLVYWISPHQYAKIMLGEKKYVNIDLWAEAYGIKFGEYARGFNILNRGSKKSCQKTEKFK